MKFWSVCSFIQFLSVCLFINFLSFFILLFFIKFYLSVFHCLFLYKVLVNLFIIFFFLIWLVVIYICIYFHHQWTPAVNEFWSFCWEPTSLSLCCIVFQISLWASITASLRAFRASNYLWRSDWLKLLEWLAGWSVVLSRY